MKKKAKHLRNKKNQDILEVFYSMIFGLIYSGLFILFFI